LSIRPYIRPGLLSVYRDENFAGKILRLAEWTRLKAVFNSCQSIAANVDNGDGKLISRPSALVQVWV